MEWLHANIGIVIQALVDLSGVTESVEDSSLASSLATALVEIFIRSASFSIDQVKTEDKELYKDLYTAFVSLKRWKERDNDML